MAIGENELLVIHTHKVVVINFLTGPAITHASTVSKLLSPSHPQWGMTALHMASENGHHETVRLLLERKADPDIQNKVRVVYI